MPLDTRIALSGQPLQLESPLAQYGQLMSVMNAGSQNQLAQMQISAAQRAAEEEIGVKDFLSTNPDLGTADNQRALLAAGGAKGLAYIKAFAEQKKLGLESDKTAAELLGLAHKNFNSVNSPYAAAQMGPDGVITYVKNMYADPLLGPQAKKVKPLEQAIQENLALFTKDSTQWTLAHSKLEGQQLLDVIKNAEARAAETRAFAPPVATPPVATPTAPAVAPAAIPAVAPAATTPAVAPAAKPSVLNNLALQIQGIEEQRNRLLPDIGKSAAVKAQWEDLGKKIENLSKGFSVSAGGAYTIPGVGTFERPPTPSEFEQLLANSNLTDAQKKAARLARISKESTHAPPTQISLTQNAEKSYGTAFGGKIADLDVAKYDAASKAPELAANANRVLTSLNDGNVFVGPAATVKLNLARVLNAAGASNDEKIANTETLVSNLGRNTLGMVKSSGLGIGQGFTDKDLQFLEKVAGGSIDYNAQTLRNLAELSHKAAEASANTWNKRSKEIPASAIAGTGISTEAITVPARTAKAAVATRPAGVPAEWTLHTDAAGKKAYVSPDGKSFKEVP